MSISEGPRVEWKSGERLDRYIASLPQAAGGDFDALFLCEQLNPGGGGAVQRDISEFKAVRAVLDRVSKNEPKLIKELEKLRSEIEIAQREVSEAEKRLDEALAAFNTQEHALKLSQNAKAELRSAQGLHQQHVIRMFAEELASLGV